jgi:hypothetical protein
MFKKEDILNQLNSGKSIESIAAELTDALNQANDEYIAAQKVSETRSKKEALARQFCDLIREYAAIECPEATDVLVPDSDDIDAMIDAIDDMFKALQFAMTMKNMFEAPQKASVKASKSDDDILSDFISKICQ